MKDHLLKYLISCLFCFLPLLGFSQQDKIDSLLNLIESSKEDSNKVNLLNQLCQQYRNDDPEKAMKYGNLAISLAEVLEYKRGIAASYENFGRIYRNKGEYNEALDNHLKSIKIYEEIKYIAGITAGLNNVGIIYYFQQNYDKALEYFRQMLDYYKAANDSSGQGTALDNIGVMHKQKGDYDEARRYHKLSMEIRGAINDQNGVASCLQNIAIAYAMEDKLELAIENIKKAYSILEQSGDKFRMAGILGNIGEMYADLAEYLKNNDGDEMAIRVSYEKAKEYMKRSLEIAEEIGAKNELTYGYENIAAVYSHLGDYDKAYEYHKLFSAIQDSIYTEERSSSMAEMQSKYEVDKERKEKEILQKDKEIQNVQLNRQTIIIWFTAIGIALLLALVFMILRWYFQKQKINLQLESKNSSIMRQKEQIESINVELEKLSIVASETDNSIFIMDAEGNLEWANKGFTKLFGYTFEEYLNEKGNNLIEVSDNPDIKKLITECIKNKKSIVYEALNEAKDGNKHWVQTTLTPILSNDGRVNKLVAIDSDITVQKKGEHEIMEKNKEITDSINYAQNIQQAILPSEGYFNKLLPNSFILFKPQAIVSGDFYWMTERDGKVFYCAADCTGHGVPGAFMSMMCSSLLTEAVNAKGIEKPNEIFFEVRKGIISNLKQSGETQKDGMDAVLCAWDKKSNSMEFALANNSLMIINPKRNKWPEGSVEFGEGWAGEIKPDKQPIGFLTGEQKPFTNHKFNLEPGDTIYIYSDGYLDQFGGPRDKKYGRKRFRELLLSIQAKSMTEQKKVLDKTIEDWKGESEQIDDILMIGVKFS